MIFFAKSLDISKNTLNFASLLRRTRAFSSAGSEHLPYKQRVGGSNPSTPTKKKLSIAESFFYALPAPPWCDRREQASAHNQKVFSQIVFSMGREHIDDFSALDYLKGVRRVARDRVCVAGTHYYVDLLFAVHYETVFA